MYLAIPTVCHSRGRDSSRQSDHTKVFFKESTGKLPVSKPLSIRLQPHQHPCREIRHGFHILNIDDSL